MQVARVVSPVSSRESWTVLGDDDAPVAPVERYWASTRRTASWWATASGTCSRHSGPVPWASDCSRLATAARSSSGRAHTASTPTRPRC